MGMSPMACYPPLSLPSLPLLSLSEHIMTLIFSLFQVSSLNFNFHCSRTIFLHLSSIALWSITKKKPLVVKPHHAPSMTSSVPEEHWVTAVAAYPNTDLVASGTYIVHYSIVLLILQLYPPSNFVLIQDLMMGTSVYGNVEKIFARQSYASVYHW